MTSTDLVALAVPVAALLLSGVLVVLVLRLRRESRRTAEELRHARAETAALEARVGEMSRPTVGRSAVEQQEFVITRVGDDVDTDPAVPARLEGRLFADIVLRESVVRAAGLAHGLRRALAPDTRHRIRFEMRRELRRARRRRREELRDLRRGSDRGRRKAA